MKIPKQPKLTAKLVMISRFGMKSLVRENRNGKSIYWVMLPSIGDGAPTVYFDQIPSRLQDFYEQEISDRFTIMMWRVEAA